MLIIIQATLQQKLSLKKTTVDIITCSLGHFSTAFINIINYIEYEILETTINNNSTILIKLLQVIQISEYLF